MIHLLQLKNVNCRKTALEIARSYARNLKLIIMDEPTSALNEEETQKLFGLIDQLKNPVKV